MARGYPRREDEDVASVVWKFLLESEHRDCNNITIWCDNGTGQNKKIDFVMKYCTKFINITDSSENSHIKILWKRTYIHDS